jgi:hypothetical protein
MTKKTESKSYLTKLRIFPLFAMFQEADSAYLMQKLGKLDNSPSKMLFYIISFQMKRLSIEKILAKLVMIIVFITFLLVIDFMESPLWKNCHLAKNPVPT